MRPQTVLLLAGSGFERRAWNLFCGRCLAAATGAPGSRRALNWCLPAAAARLGVAPAPSAAQTAWRTSMPAPDILVHPAIYNFSTVVEAMACGCCARLRVNGAAEIIRPGLQRQRGRRPGGQRGRWRRPLRRSWIPPPAPAPALPLNAEALPMSLNVEKTLAVIEELRANLPPASPPDPARLGCAPSRRVTARARPPAAVHRQRQPLSWRDASVIVVMKRQPHPTSANRMFAAKK